MVAKYNVNFAKKHGIYKAIVYRLLRYQYNSEIEFSKCNINNSLIKIEGRVYKTTNFNSISILTGLTYLQVYNSIMYLANMGFIHIDEDSFNKIEQTNDNINKFNYMVSK